MVVGLSEQKENKKQLIRLLASYSAITNSQEILYLSMAGGLWDTIHPGVCKGSAKLARQQ